MPSGWLPAGQRLPPLEELVVPPLLVVELLVEPPLVVEPDVVLLVVEEVEVVDEVPMPEELPVVLPPLVLVEVEVEVDVLVEVEVEVLVLLLDEPPEELLDVQEFRSATHIFVGGEFHSVMQVSPGGQSPVDTQEQAEPMEHDGAQRRAKPA
jgi:hypothetical protein